MKNQFLKIICLMAFCFLADSCGIARDWEEHERIRQLGKLYTGDAHYISIDSVHNTPEKKQKFEELKAQFLKTWLDTGNCYIYISPRTKNRGHIYIERNIRRISISNILHSPKYDTVIVLLSWHVHDPEEKYVSGTWAMGWSAIIDSTGKWNFRCEGSTYVIGGNDDGEDFEYTDFQLKRLMVKARYLTEDKQQDPTFFHRVFTDSDIWFRDWDISPQDNK
jgi:hypothetical protein